MTRDEVCKQIKQGIKEARASQDRAQKFNNKLLGKYSEGREDGMIYALRLIEDYMNRD